MQKIVKYQVSYIFFVLAKSSGQEIGEGDLKLYLSGLFGEVASGNNIGITQYENVSDPCLLYDFSACWYHVKCSINQRSIDQELGNIY